MSNRYQLLVNITPRKMALWVIENCIVDNGKLCRNPIVEAPGSYRVVSLAAVEFLLLLIHSELICKCICKID